MGDNSLFYLYVSFHMNKLYNGMYRPDFCSQFCVVILRIFS